MKMTQRYISSLVSIAIAFSPYSSSARNYSYERLEHLQDVYMNAPRSTPVDEIIQQAEVQDLPSLVDEGIKLGYFSQWQIKEAELMHLQLEKDGKSIHHLTKEDVQSRLPQVKVANAGLFLLALLPLAIAFMGRSTSTKLKQQEVELENQRNIGYLEERTAEAELRIKEAEARAAEAEEKLKQSQTKN